LLPLRRAPVAVVPASSAVANNIERTGFLVVERDASPWSCSAVVSVHLNNQGVANLSLREVMAG